MTRARRPRARGAPREITAEQTAWLAGGDGGVWALSWRYEVAGTPPSPIELWTAHRARVVREHVASEPGTRPVVWWTMDAPSEPRRRLGGVGTPSHEVLAVYAEHRFGVPVHWIWPDLAECYRLIGRPLAVPAVDVNDPPRFESEAAYLRRLGLLLPGELRRLDETDFEPVSLLDVFEFSDQA